MLIVARAADDQGRIRPRHDHAVSLFWLGALHPAARLLCEVLSPSTVGIDRVRKMPIYLEHGIDFVWLVHPGDRTLEVYRREEGRWIVAANFQGEQTVRAEPFDAVEIELCHLWED